jgi:signal transduction histidine kinase
MTRPRAWAIGLTAVAVAADVLAWSWAVRWPDAALVPEVALTTLLAVPAVVCGLVIALRRADNPVGPLLVAMATAFVAVALLSGSYASVVTLHPDALPVVPLPVALSQGAWMLLFVPAAYLLLLFPDGHLSTPRWRAVAWSLAGVPALFVVVAAGTPEDYPPPFQDLPHVVPSLGAVTVPVGVALVLAFMALLVASAASMVVRFRRATDPVLRAQLRWFTLGALFLPATLLLCWLSFLLLGGPDLVGIGLAATLVAIPAATAVALLRHDLYDVDRVVSASITYGLLTTLLLAVFTLLEAFTGALLGQRSAATALVATAALAIALSPLRRALQRRVDRRLYPLRRSALDALDVLRERVDAGTAQPEELEQVLRAALHDDGLRIGYAVPGQPGLVDAQGEPVDSDGPRATPVLLGTTRIGLLVPRDGAASRELLREVSAASSLLVEVVRLRSGIADVTREVTESRRRLLGAGYEERRRLQRDLHDGAQQRLVSLGMALRLAQRHLDPRDVELDGLLDQAVAELGTAVAELRSISHGLRPASLGGGLAPALRDLVASVPVTVDLDVDLDGLDIPDDVATTAYYVASEALANALKHADPRRLVVSAVPRDGGLALRVQDDGRGGATTPHGSGLAGLRDRVAAAGGHLAVMSGAGLGTTVEAVLPCGS